jgi:hypothetical protein
MPTDAADVCSWGKTGSDVPVKMARSTPDLLCDERSIAMLAARRPHLFFAHLFGACVEPGYRPIHLPKLHIVAVDEPCGGFDGGLVITAIQLHHANGSAV